MGKIVSAFFSPLTANPHDKKLNRFFTDAGVLPLAPAIPPSDSEATSRLVNTPQFPTRLFVEEKGGNGSRVSITYQGWSDLYRVRPVQSTTSKAKPPCKIGPRFTDRLTANGKRAIDDSARYLASLGKGYTTMITLTLNRHARLRTSVQIAEGNFCTLDGIEHTLHGRYSVWPRENAPRIVECNGVLKPQQTIQRELSRWLDAIKRVYERGMEYTLQSEDDLFPDQKIKIAGHDTEADPLLYCWVAECPKNDEGDDNLHVHMLLNWQVELMHFPAWAARLEKLWGNGFAHIEKLQKPEAAGNYVLKAAGYATKGEDGGQGWIIGNRYFIGREARAPGFDQVVAVVNAQDIPRRLSEVSQYQSDLFGGLRRQRAAAREALPTANHAGRAKLKKLIERVRQVVDLRPVIAGRWQTLCRGIEGLAQLVGWLRDATPAAGLPSHGEVLAQLLDAPLLKTPQQLDMQDGIANRWWQRALNSMPFFDDDDLDGQRQFAERWQPCFA